MAEIHVAAERIVGAPAADVYRLISDYRQHHPRFLPPAFSGFHVEEGGVGAGTVIRFQIRAGGRTQRYLHRVAEPEPGHVLTEGDDKTHTTFTVTPESEQPGADRQPLPVRRRHSRVLRATVWPAHRPSPLRGRDGPPRPLRSRADGRAVAAERMIRS